MFFPFISISTDLLFLSVSALLASCDSTT
jgi:hypothetical protein